MRLARWWVTRRASRRAGDAPLPDLPLPSEGGSGLPRPAPLPEAENPFTLAIKFGRCPMCMGSGEIGQLAICLHDGPLCPPGSPCHLCLGTGRWPPPGNLSEDGG